MPRASRRCSICATAFRCWRGSASGCSGSAPRGRLPQWSRAALSAAPLVPGSGREVVLLVDTFNRWFEPENARAAERVLARAGYRVVSPDPARGRPLCCGRTFLAAGLVDEAREEARRMVAALSPHVRGRHPDRRPRTLVPVDLARRIPGDPAGRRDQGARRPRPAVRGIRRGRARRRPVRTGAEADARHAPHCCTAIAIKRPLPPSAPRSRRCS